MRHTLSRATASDVVTVNVLLADRYRDPPVVGPDDVAAGLIWLLREEGTGAAVATMTMSMTADPDLWTTAERASPALYLSRLTTRPGPAGRGLGALLGQAAWRYSRDRAIARIRWDVGSSAGRLQGYCEGLGATRLRSVEASGGAVLYEWSYRAPPAGTARDAAAGVLRLDAPVVEIARFPQAGMCWPPATIPRPDAGPDHWHEVSDLLAANLGAPGPTPQRPLTADPWEGAVLLFHSGDTWRAHRTWAHPVTGPAVRRLNRSLPYHLGHVVDGRACYAVLTGDRVPKAPPPANSWMSR